MEKREAVVYVKRTPEVRLKYGLGHAGLCMGITSHDGIGEMGTRTNHSRKDSDLFASMLIHSRHGIVHRVIDLAPDFFEQRTNLNLACRQGLRVWA